MGISISMDVPFSLAIFLLSHLLLLLHSFSAQEDNKNQSTCPNSFDCKPFHHPLHFPFSNSTYPHCGSCTVTCDEPLSQIQLGNEGPWYDVVATEENLSGNIFQIHDQFLQTQLENKSCDVFKNLSIPNTSSISFTIYSYLTFFKCDKSFHLVAPKDHFHNYTNCKDYNLYYKYPHYKDPDYQSSPPAPLPSSCSVIQLPLNLSKTNPNEDDLFNLLTHTYSLEFHVSEDCWRCYIRGGQCQNDNQKFHCATNEVVTKGRKLILILGTVVAGIGIIVILLFCIIRKLTQNDESTFFWKNKTESYQNVEAFLKNYGYLAPKRYTYSHIKKMTNSFSVKLGQGGYGCVFKGNLDNGSLVAVKVLEGLKGSGEEFINEVATISRTSHVNIVTLMGFCFESRNRALIYEFMPNGSLEKFIHDGNSLTYHQLGWEALYQIAVGIARGLEYLHRGCNMRILHFDIKPHNILLDEDFCPKISDFGLAKLCSRKESIVSLLGARGTAGYIAPEVFCRNIGGVSHKSDVYSYGMMVLEMVGGRKNIDVEVDRTSEIYFPHWIYKRLELDEELGVHGIMNDEANESARKMIIVGLWCIQTDPLHRPSMSKVVEMLEGSVESLQVPPKPYLSSPPRSTPESSTTFVP
ncbi:unnamed protein product [Camellia sinensis]